MQEQVWKNCGHEKTDDNTYKSTARYGRCRKCYNATINNYRSRASMALRQLKVVEGNE